jgi:hypothetical protein
MKVREVQIGGDNESKRDAIQNNLGKQVLLCDEHNLWCHGTLLDGEDKTTYHLRSVDSKEQMRFHYHDLSQLLVLRD